MTAVTVALEQLSIVVCGHVDHGKSTIVGRLLADAGTLPDGKLEQVRALCARTSKPFEYAFLLDALRDERAQGITIDAARVFFKTARRNYVIIDAPGHVEFLKNMITGAAHAAAALLVVDAQEGLRENSRRHAYLLSFLGIRQVVVLVNKMDLVGHDPATFAALGRAFGAFLDTVGIAPSAVVPVCGRDGDNVVFRSLVMPWYDGPTVLEALDALDAPKAPVDKPFRMPVQDVYKFTSRGDDRRIVAGTIETGRIRVGDEVAFYPSGKRSRVRSLEAFNAVPPTSAEAGQATGFTLDEQIYVTRGELATLAAEPSPSVATRIGVSLFWLGASPLEQTKSYVLRVNGSRVPMRVEAIHRVMDAADLEVREARAQVDRHQVAECTLRLGRPVAVDLVDDLPLTSRFVVVDDYDIRGGGIVREILPDAHASLRDGVRRRNAKWEASTVAPERRAERYSQHATLVVLTGAVRDARLRLAKALERQLFDDGRLVYFLGMANVRYGVDADLGGTGESRQEHLRRLGEIANILLDSGMILVATAGALTQDDVAVIRTAVDPGRVATVWVGSPVTTDLACELLVDADPDPTEGINRIKRHLQERGAIFRCS